MGESIAPADKWKCIIQLIVFGLSAVDRISEPSLKSGIITRIYEPLIVTQTPLSQKPIILNRAYIECRGYLHFITRPINPVDRRILLSATWPFLTQFCQF